MSFASGSAMLMRGKSLMTCRMGGVSKFRRSPTDTALPLLIDLI
jgi:hypothetical protein